MLYSHSVSSSPRVGTGEVAKREDDEMQLGTEGPELPFLKPFELSVNDLIAWPL